jgi:hypothetical protein
VEIFGNVLLSVAKNLYVSPFAALRVTNECANLVWFDLAVRAGAPASSFPVLDTTMSLSRFPDFTLAPPRAPLSGPPSLDEWVFKGALAADRELVEEELRRMP